jgi:hypothetical protein
LLHAAADEQRTERCEEGRDAIRPATIATPVPKPARIVETNSRLAISTATPTDRSMPPDATASVMPNDTMASKATLLSSTLLILAGVRKVGVVSEKNRMMPTKPTTTP